MYLDLNLFRWKPEKLVLLADTTDPVEEAIFRAADRCLPRLEGKLLEHTLHILLSIEETTTFRS